MHGAKKVLRYWKWLLFVFWTEQQTASVSVSERWNMGHSQRYRQISHRCFRSKQKHLFTLKFCPLNTQNSDQTGQNQHRDNAGCLCSAWKWLLASSWSRWTAGVFLPAVNKHECVMLKLHSSLLHDQDKDVYYMTIIKPLIWMLKTPVNQ